LGQAFLVALFAFQYRADPAFAALGGEHPRTRNPRRIVPYVLAVPAFKVCHPMTLHVLMEVDDFPLHPAL
jgi:hypothetical protein